MNIFYFVSRWPRYDQSAKADKILSMIQSFINTGNHIHLVSSDPASQQSLKDIENLPIEKIFVNPNKIHQSLVSASSKPDIAIFNNIQLEHMYSIFLYSKWKKCFRILQLNRLQGLQQWRKSQYKLLNPAFIHQYNCPMNPDQETSKSQKFSKKQLQSIYRSDYYFCGNDYISNYIKTNLNSNNYILNSFGIPTAEFHSQIKQLQVRQWRHRRHFAFLGNLLSDKNIGMIDSLINNIWPIINKELKNVQLHIFGSGYNKGLQSRKKELEKMNIFLKGFLEESEDLQRYRAVLYPLQYACGLKGAIIESWFHHTPIVTTPIGAQGLFFQTCEQKFSGQNNGNGYSGFFKQRQFTQQEISNSKKLKEYYRQSKLSQKINDLTFGGLCNSFSHVQFANNALRIYNNEELWKECLLNSRKTLLKHHSQGQLQINLAYGISQLQIVSHSNRSKKQYCQAWDTYFRSKQGYNKLNEKKNK